MQFAKPIFTPGNGIGKGTKDSKQLIIRAKAKSKEILTNLFVDLISYTCQSKSLSFSPMIVTTTALGKHTIGVATLDTQPCFEQ